MVINKSKVISLPREYRDNEDLFVCPCPVCVERMYSDQAEKAQVEQAKNIIEEIFQNSALKVKDFQIQVAYADTIPTAPANKPRPETRASRAAIKAVLGLTTRFNKKYRHPLVCQLNALALDTQTDILHYEAMVEYGDLVENQLWKLEAIATQVTQIAEILSQIGTEAFLSPERVVALDKKIEVISRSNKIQLKKLFINALKIPEFEPHCTFEDFQLPYY